MSAGKKHLSLTSKRETVNLLVNSCVVNPVQSVKGYPQKKGVNPVNCHYTEIKHVKDASCVDHLSFVNFVTNVPTVAPVALPVGAKLHQFWEKWAAI